ncbi:hypothetical protein EMMF5_000559 [Cystobasidiomycetes sp. EMM_F5]
MPVSAESSPDSKLGQEPAVVDAVEVTTTTATGSPRVVVSKDESIIDVALTQQQAQEHRQWHEDRIRRRLLNEYEQRGRALSEIVSNNLDTPLRLNAIRVVGAKHTRTDFLARIAAPFLSDDKDDSQRAYSDTLRGVLQKTRGFREALQKFDIFSEIEEGLESSPGVMNTDQDVDLIVKVKEGSKYFLRTATDVGDGEGSATATARIRNAFGGGETLEGNASFGTRTKSSFQVRAATPLFADPTTTLSLSAFAIERDLSYFASCRERVRGGRLSFRGLSALGEHEVAYEGALRNLCDVGKNASMTIRNAAGLSVKSALSHTLLRDTRDDPFIATRGMYTRLVQEYAGLGGDATFIKSENEAQISRPIGGGCTLSLALRGGLLYPLGGKPSHMLDRFHLGGPTSVRMFKMNGLGPRDNNDFVGGDLQWAAGLSLITTIPKRPDWPLKGHVFLNAGRLVSFDKTLARSFNTLLHQPAVSAGVGLMYKHSIVRLEFNVGMPIVAHEGDGVRKGFQVGLGLHFL